MRTPTSAESATEGGLSTGIQIHGNWTIDVKEPNGTLVSHLEFENALTEFGHQSLLLILGRDASVGLWEVDLLGPSGGNGPCLSPTSPELCVLYEPTGATRSYAYNNLAVTVIFAETDCCTPEGDIFVITPGVLELSGTATAQQDGEIVSVLTIIQACGPSIAPSSNCDSGGVRALTRTDLPENVVFVDGQLIEVTVRISFS